jgi:hypothetical protein
LASSLSQDQLLRLARHGAEARISELRNEIAAIQSAFPDLGGTAGRSGRKQNTTATSAASAADSGDAPSSGERSGSGRRSWNAAQRKAAADRMKSYWAKRKAGKKT